MTAPPDNARSHQPSPVVEQSPWAEVDAFLTNDDPIETPEQAIRLLCMLQAQVADEGPTDFPSTSADCWCGERESRVSDMVAEHGRDEWIRNYFRNSGDEIRFIIRTTRAALPTPRSRPPSNGTEPTGSHSLQAADDAMNQSMHHSADQSEP